MNNEHLPECGYTVKRTNGDLEDDWCCLGHISYDEKRKSTIVRVFKHTRKGEISKYVLLRDFLGLNPIWTEKAREVCGIAKLPFP